MWICKTLSYQNYILKSKSQKETKEHMSNFQTFGLVMQEDILPPPPPLELHGLVVLCPAWFIFWIVRIHALIYILSILIKICFAAPHGIQTHQDREVKCSYKSLAYFLFANRIISKFVLLLTFEVRSQILGQNHSGCCRAFLDTLSKVWWGCLTFFLNPESLFSTF
jgi:hypothetical protein